MTLTEKERSILAQVELDAQRSLQEVAKSLGIRDYTVQHTLRRLREREVITPKPFIDIARVGKMNIGLYFTLALTEQKQWQEFMRQVQASPQVAYFQSLAGDFHFLAAFHCHHLNDMHNFLQDLYKWSNGTIVSRTLVPRVRFRRYRRKYLTSVEKQEAALEALDTPEQFEISPEEFEFLSYLGEANNLSIRQAARSLQIPYSTADYRYQSLVDKGVIRGWFYDVKTSYLGVQKFKLLIACRHLTSTFEQQLECFAREHSKITYFLQTLGDWDIELGFESRNTTELNSIIALLYEKFSEQILQIKSLSELEVHKHTLFPDRMDSA